MLDVIIRGGLVVTPEDVGERDIGIQDGKIVAVAWPGTLLTDTGRVIEAQGKIVLPGGIEPHAHIGMGVDLKLMGFERCKVGRPSGIRHWTLSKKHAAREITHASGYHVCSFRARQFYKITGFARGSQ
jgi:formylmethanofuran dehydrogenase subunit A